MRIESVKRPMRAHTKSRGGCHGATDIPLQSTLAEVGPHGRPRHRVRGAGESASGAGQVGAAVPQFEQNFEPPIISTPQPVQYFF